MTRSRTSPYPSLACAVVFIGAGLATPSMHAQISPSVCSAVREDYLEFPSARRADVLRRARPYVNFTWTPKAGNLDSDGRTIYCTGTPIKTSALFQADQPVLGFPYKQAGYDSIGVLETCINEPQPKGDDTQLYLFGTITRMGGVGRGCGVLGLDCAGFISKAWRGTDNDYMAPAIIGGLGPSYKPNCRVAADGKDYARAKPADILKRYVDNPPANTPNHFMLVVGNYPDKDNPEKGKVVVYEAGSVIAPPTYLPSDPISHPSDRVRSTCITYDTLSKAGFQHCVPVGLRGQADSSVHFTIPANTSLFGGGSTANEVILDSADQERELRFVDPIQGQVSCCGDSQMASADGGWGFGECGGDPTVDCDGRETTPGTDINPMNGVSGVTHDERMMFLMGVFMSDDGCSDPAPPNLRYSLQSDDDNDAVIGTGRRAYDAPALCQSFFIGDGYTGDSTDPESGRGEPQTFRVPIGATRLRLGFADGINLGTGIGGTDRPADPSCYGDNEGNLTGAFTVIPAKCY